MYFCCPLDEYIVYPLTAGVFGAAPAGVKSCWVRISVSRSTWPRRSATSDSHCSSVYGSTGIWSPPPQVHGADRPGAPGLAVPRDVPLVRAEHLRVAYEERKS